MRTVPFLALSLLVAGCLGPQPPPEAPVDPLPAGPTMTAGWDAGEEFALDGCVAFVGELVVDADAVAARLPAGFAPMAGRRPLVQTATCGNALLGTGEPGLGDLFLAYVPVVPRAGGDFELFLLEASTSWPEVNAVFAAAGIPSDLVEVHRPRAPAASWEVVGNLTDYTITPPATNTPNKVSPPDGTFRLWGGVDGSFAGHVSLVDRSGHDQLPTPCSMFAGSGALYGLGPLPADAVYGDTFACTGQTHGGGIRLVFDAPPAPTT